MDAAKPDADNVIPPRRPIDPEGPAAYWTRLPLRSILHDFAKHEIPAALSSDAGTFVCNSLFYHLLNWSAGQERRILSGFVSLPIVNGRPHERGLSIEQQTAAVDDVLRESVRYFLQPSSRRHSDLAEDGSAFYGHDFLATCESCGFDTWSRTYRHTPDRLFRTISVLSVRIMHFVLRAAC